MIIFSPGAFLVSSLKGKVGNFTSGNYKAVTGLAYDPTNKKLGLKVGADTVIPFNSKHDFVLNSSETLISTYTTQNDGYYCINSINYSSGYQNEIKIDGVIHSLNFVFNAGGEFIANGIYYLKSGVTIVPHNSNYISVLYYGE